MAWKKIHKSSGATVIESNTRGCKLVVVPVDWTSPTGAANWTASCGDVHKRGRARTVKGAKSAARRVVRAVRSR